MGIVSPLGCNIETVWSRLLFGESGLRALPSELTSNLSSKVGAIVPTLEEDIEGGFDPNTEVNPKEQRKMDRFILFAIAATNQAISQAKWSPKTEIEKERTATIIASGIGGFHSINKAMQTVENFGPHKLSPFTIPSFLANMAAAHVSILNNFKGPIGTPVTACAAGTQAIGDAARMIRSGEVDIAVCGGADAFINSVSLGGFAAARALSTNYNNNPKQASRPFDRGRDGFVLGEGAGVLVIEELEHALARKAQPIAELVGYGTTSDAHHITSGLEQGEGAQRAMKIALQQAGISATDLQHINAHGTSTPLGDLAELAAIKAVFGADNRVAVTSTKSATGHLQGAAGGVEAIFTALAIRDQIVPATLNLVDPDINSKGINIVRDKSKPMFIEYAMSNGFGFGGINACIVLKRWLS